MLLLCESRIPDTGIRCVGSGTNGIHQLGACWSYKGVGRGVVRLPAAELSPSFIPSNCPRLSRLGGYFQQTPCRQQRWKVALAADLFSAFLAALSCCTAAAYPGWSQEHVLLVTSNLCFLCYPSIPCPVRSCLLQPTQRQKHPLQHGERGDILVPPWPYIEPSLLPGGQVM